MTQKTKMHDYGIDYKSHKDTDLTQINCAMMTLNLPHG